jgi:hypothetical protein
MDSTICEPSALENGFGRSPSMSSARFSYYHVSMAAGGERKAMLTRAMESAGAGDRDSDVRLAVA